MPYLIPIRSPKSPRRCQRLARIRRQSPANFMPESAENSSGTRVAKRCSERPICVCARWPTLYNRRTPACRLRSNRKTCPRRIAGSHGEAIAAARTARGDQDVRPGDGAVGPRGERSRRASSSPSSAPAAAARARCSISSRASKSRTPAASCASKATAAMRPTCSVASPSCRSGTCCCPGATWSTTPSWRSRSRACRAGAGARQGAQDAAGVRPDRLREPVSASIVRRHAPARGADAHLPVRARPDAAGRAVRRARRADAGDDAALAARRLAEIPAHHPLHHP